MTASFAAPRLLRSFPRKRESRTALSKFVNWVPAPGSPRRERRGVPLAGTSGGSAASRTTWRARVPRGVRRRDRLVLMVVVVCVSISAMLRVERRLDRGEPRAEAAQHVFQHAIAPDAQRVAHHLHLGVAIADVPGESGELLRACGRDLEQRL